MLSTSVFMLQTSEKPRNIYVSYHSQSQKAVHKNMDGYSLYKEVRQAKPFIVDKNCFLCFLGAQLQLPTPEEQLKLVLWQSIKICKNYTKSLNFGTHPCNCIKSILFGTCTSNQDFVYTSKAKLTFNGR